MAILRAWNDCMTSISSLSWAARVKMLMMTLQPDLMWGVFDRQIFVMHITIYSLICDRVAKLCNMIYSNGFKKSFWKLKLANSSLRRNLSASYLNESIAKIDTFKFSWLPTLTKCSLSICQILVHTNLILAMFKSATSTRAYKLNFLELTISLSS